MYNIPSYYPFRSIQPCYPYHRSVSQETSYKSLEEALVLIEQAVSGEREDELFYDYLVSVAPTQEIKDIIISIRDDERKHNRMFRMIYEAFTGKTIQSPTEVQFQKPNSFIEGIEKALMGELRAVEKYRNIRAGMPNRYYRDMIFEIITDELKHASKYNFIMNLELKRKLKDVTD
ncbi:ferritin-like domain-containing protein [Paenibacillus sp. EZ-K15]|uniref:ferritin family protein n=1 Tax=Paenibacillus sp. EZ-K15 TaxID=2044275 RepID=UPI000BF58F33|nr:ferritin-like domain-containing protein [Paenibacillus sp. EZ-K15]